jgi:glycosyltransferase involved in cell wall biosynthesis
MKILIITDAWAPQVNGVVRTYHNILKHFDAKVVHPYEADFKRRPLTGYEEIEVVTNPWKVKRHVWVAMHEGYYIHVATEGPLGLFAKRELDKNDYPYTTSLHTLFPEFIQTRFGIPTWATYPYFRWFHKRSRNILVPTHGIKQHLEDKGFDRITVWTRGVDPSIFNPSQRQKTDRPYILSVSRISKEKGLDDFCKLDYPRKVVVGDGPYLDELKRKYPDVEFLGKKEGVALAYWYANAEAFVFSSKADTFGIVLLESIACGTPVAAYPEPGPLEVLTEENGGVNLDLHQALQQALTRDRSLVYESSKPWTWVRSAEQFIKSLNK